MAIEKAAGVTLNINSAPLWKRYSYSASGLIADEKMRRPDSHIYASPNIWNNRVAWHRYDFSECPLWIATWNVAEPAVPQTWSKQGKSWQWWQHSSKGQVDGILGAVDLNWVRP